jgi:hypothetical protein
MCWGLAGGYLLNFQCVPNKQVVGYFGVAGTCSQDWVFFIDTARGLSGAAGSHLPYQLVRRFYKNLHGH